MRRMKYHAAVILLSGMSLLIGSAMSLGQVPPGAGKFQLGADISGLAGGRATGIAGARPGGRGQAVAYNDAGIEGAEYAIMMKHGWSVFRLRVFESPVRQAPNNTLENTIALAKQIKAAGGVFMLDIHYSDTWADPQHQETPVAWRELDVAGIEKRVEDYSRDVVSRLKAAGAMPEMVQVGNEITGGLLWPSGHLHVPDSPVKSDAGQIRGGYLEPYDEAKVWDHVTRYLKAGIRGVKAAAGESQVQIIMHIDCGGDWQVTKWWFDHITDAKVEYDIIGQSFYPNYHGTLAMLQENMIECRKRYNKPFMVVETGYPQTGGEGIMSPPEAIAKPNLAATTPKEKGYMQWPGTPQGQLQFMADLISTVQRNGGTGVNYWAPEAQGRGNGLWKSDGSPAAAIFVMDRRSSLTTQPASRLPEAVGK